MPSDDTPAATSLWMTYQENRKEQRHVPWAPVDLDDNAMTKER